MHTVSCFQERTKDLQPYVRELSDNSLKKPLNGSTGEIENAFTGCRPEACGEIV